jgi:hypothetical protein
MFCLVEQCRALILIEKNMRIEASAGLSMPSTIEIKRPLMLVEAQRYRRQTSRSSALEMSKPKLIVSRP